MRTNIKELREKKCMTQEELAENSGVCRATISGLENGTERNTSSKTLLAIARTLGTTIDALFFNQSV